MGSDPAFMIGCFISVWPPRVLKRGRSLLGVFKRRGKEPLLPSHEVSNQRSVPDI